MSGPNNSQNNLLCSISVSVTFRESDMVFYMGQDAQISRIPYPINIESFKQDKPYLIALLRDAADVLERAPI